jgi:hypothetical protein
MKINYNSLSAKMFRYFYTTDTMATNLCPYFWKLLVAMILFIPYYVLTIPTKVLNFGDAYTNKEHISRSIIIWILIVAVCCTLFAIGTLVLGVYYDEKIQPVLSTIQYIGFTGLVLLGSVLAAWIIVSFKEKYDDIMDSRGRKPRKEPKPNLIVEFLKAKYHRYCPQITWDKSESI